MLPKHVRYQTALHPVVPVSLACPAGDFFMIHPFRDFVNTQIHIFFGFFATFFVFFRGSKEKALFCGDEAAKTGLIWGDFHLEQRAHYRQLRIFFATAVVACLAFPKQIVVIRNLMSLKIILECLLDGLLCQHRAVQLVRWQAVQRLRDGAVGQR